MLPTCWTAVVTAHPCAKTDADALDKEALMLNTLTAITERLQSYLSAEISKQIGPHVGMFVPGAESHYMRVGRSAIEAIAQIMIATGKTSFGTVLDLPCGGGRVTRHLVKFF